MRDELQKITVVVPTYNERDNLPKLVAELAALAMPNLHILVVDDNSPDGTGDVADKLALESEPALGVLHRTAKDGLGRAYIAGMQRALDEGADIVIQMDADLSHPSSAIPAMVTALDNPDVAVVLGSRYVPGGSVAGDWGLYRKALSAWANFYVGAILRMRVKDATAGFKAWRAESLRRIEIGTIASNGYSFQVEMNYRTIRRGMKIVEVPIRFSDRALGKSKMSIKVQLESAMVPWKLRFGRNRIK
ncbi:polyprenol monophosphomannose synthase [Dactylosporangium darangshiense]|uniref:Polyprenol monophosphomannose synthase n=1 Tax=Dactylosporangium darangshiense TaxID=579108 RepID=A0ABP8DSV0_9ACTN